MAVIIEKLPPAGQFIILRLDELKKTQKWLANATGLSYVYVQQLLHGQSKNPSARVVFSLADALQVEPRKIYELFCSWYHISVFLQVFVSMHSPYCKYTEK